MDYEQLLKEFRETVTAAISNGNVQVTQKLDNVIQRLGELEKSIISLDNHRTTSMEKIAGLQSQNTGMDVRLKDLEKQLLTIQIQGQGISKIGSAAWSIGSSVIVGVVLWLLTKK